MHDLAKSKLGKCLSKKYVDSSTKLEWECKEGHIWEAIPSNVKKGHWCPKCSFKKIASHKRLDLEIMKKIAISKGGICLSNEYKNCGINLKWKCDKGHLWDATIKQIKYRKKWCPECNK